MAESNSVFISYRRNASAYLALAIYQDLHTNNIDSFYDVESIDSGTFDTIILNQIAARPYFMPILTPGTLERCMNTDDWVLREMNHAMQLDRVFVPIYTPEFNNTDIDRYLPVTLAAYVKRHNMVEVPQRFFRYAMEDVRDRFLKPIALLTTPTPLHETAYIARKQEVLAAKPAVTDKQLTAQEHFARALAEQKAGDLLDALDDYDQAIRLSPKYVDVFVARGVARKANGDLPGALADYTEAIRLNPKHAMAYYNRGIARDDAGDLAGALDDYDKAIQLNPKDAQSYNNRGAVRKDQGDVAGALADYDQAIQLDPNNAQAHQNRGVVRDMDGDRKGAAADYRKVLELRPADRQAVAMRDYIRKWGG